MSTLVLKKKSLISIYGVSLLFAISSSIFIIYPNLPFSIRNLIFFIVLSTLIFFLDFPPKTKYISTLMFISFMFINHFLYDPFHTIDSVRYHEIITNYDSYGELLSQWLYEMFNDVPYKGLVKFGVIFYPFYSIFNFQDEYFLAVFNSLLMIFSIFIIFKIGKNNFYSDIISKDLFLLFLVIGLFSSGSLYFYSTVFLKDLTNLFACLIAVYALIKKRYFWFFILLLFAIHTRSYSIAVIYFYYVFLKKDMKLAVLGLLGCSAFVAYHAGATGLINTVFSSISLLISPNPFDLGNWSLYGLRTFETLMVSIGAFLTGIIFIVNKESRKMISIFLIVLFSYACIMSTVGFSWHDQRGWDYGIGTIGDNVARKKLPIIGMIYLMITYSFVKTLELIFRKKPAG